MSIENEVQKVGRIEYIEPNNLFLDSQGGKVKNGIPQPYEDYSFSVNLRVINGDRYGCGLTDDGGDIAKNVIEYSSDNGTISFMDGTTSNGQSYLTTNFTDINMNDPSTNTKECLGIESISVRYDSWYYPTVDIKFIDVRGASLMQPAEYEYYNNGPSNIGKNNANVNSNFFKAFFSFPYPLFKLSIKGFYGKEVTYDLSVLKCNVEFNSSTGNFEVNASFIGYMYGMYADLPFPFVYIAPYIDLYGKNTWDEKIKTKDFCYLTTDENNPIGAGMYTFPDLRAAVKEAGEMSDKEINNSTEGKNRVELEKLCKKLENDVIPNYPFSSKNFNWWSWSNVNTENNKEGYFFISLEDSIVNNRKMFEDFLYFAKSLEEYNQIIFSSDSELNSDKVILLKHVFEGIYKDATDVLKKRNTNAENLSAETVSSEYTDNEIKQILDNRVAKLLFEKNIDASNNVSLVFNSNLSTYGNSNESDFSDLINELIKRFNDGDIKSPMYKTSSENNWTLRVVKIGDISYKNSIVNTLNKLKEKYNIINAALVEKREQNVEETIGFKPSVRNLYNMVFAHIDTFMSAFYNTLDNIRTSIQSDDDTRKYTKLCGNGIKVDVNDNALSSESSNGGKLPPFTMFYREETEKDSDDRKFTMVWPGSLNGGDKLDEVKLVEAIINATSLNKKRNSSVSERHNIPSIEGDLVPTNYYDLIRENGNPYVDVLTDGTLPQEETVNEIIKIFSLRCFYSFLNGSFVGNMYDVKKDDSLSSVSNYAKKAKLLAEIEIGNVLRAFKMIDNEPNNIFLRKLADVSDDGKIKMTEYLTGDKSIFCSTKNGESIKYKWINKGGNNCLPLGLFNRTVITNLVTDAKNDLGENYGKFLKISKNGTTVNGDYAVRIYSGGNRIKKILEKYSSGDFYDAGKLFPNYDKVSNYISNVSFTDETFDGKPMSIADLHDNLDSKSFIDATPILPSYRKCEAGITNIFMDPLYYAQTDKKDSTGINLSKAVESRAYLFLMGIPYGKDKKFILPDRYENSDYPVLMLLREGAIYWRNLLLSYYHDDGAPLAELVNDPITYEYTINGSSVNAIQDIEKNDPALGAKSVLSFYTDIYKNSSVGRQNMLIKYFLKWANGINTEPIASVTAETKVKITLPDPVLTFREIEENMALWEINGTVKQLVSPESCSEIVNSASTNVSYFANAGLLREMYNIGTDDKLGKTNGKIRTDVFIDFKKPTSREVKDFKRNLLKLFYGFDSIIDFSCLDKPNDSATVPYGAMNVAISEFVKGLKDRYNISVEKIKKGEAEENESNGEFNSPDYFNSDDLKLACYMSLKNIYDRWLCNRKRENWYFSCNPRKQKTNGIKSDFLRFFYIDEFYHNIGMQIKPNLTDFAEMTCNLGGFTEKSKEENLASTSIIKILSSTAEKAKCALLTLPTMLGLANTYTSENNSIADVFKAYTYNDAVRSDNVETSFVVLYSNQKSSILDVPDDKGKMGYKTDGFDIANTWGKIIELPMFSDGNENSFVVPSFGVTFAKQNQSYFKDIRLSMEDHQVTDFSIRNEVAISYAHSKGPRETNIVGQDLYSVYSNYSYSCTVSMMGDAQITPLMYFQLNNIAMWKGAYMITNVRHNITPAGMTTEFTGVRQARPSVPFKDDKLLIPLDGSSKLTPQSQEDLQYGDASDDTDLNISKRPLDLINVDDVNNIVISLDRTSKIIVDDDNKWVGGTLSVIVQYNDGTIKTFENIASTREKLSGDVVKIENFTNAWNFMYTVPAGRLANVFIKDAYTNKEYRDRNDSFYAFTDGKHITIGDKILGVNLCEIITGETDYYFLKDSDFEKISFGGIYPIMIYGYDVNGTNKFNNVGEIQATYKELFNLIKRMNEAHGSLTFSITEVPKNRTIHE